MQKKLIELFKNIKYFAATTDIWTRSNLSFIAISVHYFEGFELKTVFIACEHFEGRHTHEKVAEKIKNIFQKFGIEKKVAFMTTDGAGEFTAAFRNFGDNYRSFLAANFERDVFSEDSAEDELAEDEFSTESDVVDLMLPLFTIEEIDQTCDLSFTNRIDCGAHKIDKLASVDSLDALNNDNDYKAVHTETFKTLDGIWSIKNSRFKSEHFFRVTGKKVVRPHNIRWLKHFEAVNIPFSNEKKK